MRSAGVYVGVDRQQDPSIDALAFAGRDAQAVWAAFADANEAAGHADGDHVLLVGADATCDAVRAAVAHLRDRSQQAHYDLVVLHFSCHGTPDGALVCSDTVAATLAATTLPIAEITAALRHLDAGCVVVVLDSCFSGIAAGCTPDGESAAFDALLQTMAEGKDRAVLWAAGPTGRAWETPQLRHGVLTHALVNEGLFGTFVARDGAITIPSLLAHAQHSAQDHAARAGRVQRPGLIMRIDEGPSFPHFVSGPRRARQLAEDNILPVDDDLSGLDAYGLTPPVVEAIRGRLGGAGARLTDLQRRAIAPLGSLAGRSVVVAGPTSCGKTFAHTATCQLHLPSGAIWAKVGSSVVTFATTASPNHPPTAPRGRSSPTLGSTRFLRRRRATPR